MMKLATIIAQKLTAGKLTITTAESCTGGLLAGAITDVPGASAFFKTGFIAYANEAKTDILGVPADLLKKHGAVSGPAATSMALGAKRKAGTDMAISLTGIAGPSGGTKSKPVGLVFIALAYGHTVSVRKRLFKGTRKQIRQQAVRNALAIILEALS